jgi:RecJ-like exonuclease
MRKFDFSFSNDSMKKILIVIFAAVFMLSGCGSNGQNSSNQIIKGKSVSVKGKVTQIIRGKDGYTAEIISGDGKTYSAVISSVNLAGSGQYREVKIGDAIEVEGENVSSDGSMIRVTALK